MPFPFTYHSSAEGDGDGTGGVRVDASPIETSPELVMIVVVDLAAQRLVGPAVCDL